MARSEPAAAAGTADPPPGVRLPDDRLARAAVLILRVVLAFLWIENTRWKLPPDFGAVRKQGLYLYLQDAVKYPVFPPYSWIAEHVLLPHLTFLGGAVLAVEATIGACLLVGFLTRLVGLLGVVQALAIFLSVGQTPGEWPWSYYLMIIACLAVAGIAAGRVTGVDAVLRPRLLRAHGWLRRAAVFT